jgi:hypothetical protein
MFENVFNGLISFFYKGKKERQNKEKKGVLQVILKIAVKWVKYSLFWL